MALSPFQRHTQYVLAQEAARQGGNGRHTQGYDLMLMQLAEDRRRLKGVQSTVRKCEIKRELLPKYDAWVNGVLTADGSQQDDVLMYVMLWRIDAGDYAGALTVARHILKKGWAMPPQFRRNVEATLAEELADAAKAALLAGASFDAGLLKEVLELTDGRDMHDQSLARLHKSLGWLLRDTAPAEALAHLRRAMQLDERCGVKKDIEQLERKLRNAS